MEAASAVARVVLDANHFNLGVATGSTPTRLYDRLIRILNSETRSTEMKLFALDEYVGLAPGHAESYREVLFRELVEPLGIGASNLHTPGDGPGNPASRAVAFETAIQSEGGIDLQILGIGSNGHLAFNEPGSPFNSRTRMVDLEESTVFDNSRFFASPELVPRQAITQGLGTIMESKQLILLAFGENKARAIADALQSTPSERVPASIIQTHQNVTVYLDAASASLLEGRI